MGIVGLGSIGLCVAERARAFGIKVQAVQKPRRRPHVEARAAELGITICPSLPEMLASSDIVSLHVPAAPETHHLVDATSWGTCARARSCSTPHAATWWTSPPSWRPSTAGRVRAGLDVYARRAGQRQG